MIDALPTCVEHVPVRDCIAVPRQVELYPRRLRMEGTGFASRSLNNSNDVSIFNALSVRPVEQGDREPVQVHIVRCLAGTAVRSGGTIRRNHTVVDDELACRHAARQVVRTGGRYLADKQCQPRNQHKENSRSQRVLPDGGCTASAMRTRSDRYLASMLTWRENPGLMQVMPPLERHDVASFGGCARSAPVHRQADDIDMPRKIARHVAFHVREVEDDETPDIDNPEHVYRSKHGIDGFVEHLSQPRQAGGRDERSGLVAGH